MSAPASLDRVYGALKSLFPKGLPAWEDDGSSILREQRVGAYVLGVIADLLESLFDELMPDTTELLLDRWLRLLKRDIKATDSISDKRARLFTALRRQVGYTPAKLQQLLAGPLALAPAQVEIIEMVRQQIEDALTFVDALTPTVLPAFAAPLVRCVGFPWPGVVDDSGVKITLQFSAWPGVQNFGFFLTNGHSTFSSGLIGNVVLNQDLVFQDRVTFLGQPAGLPWKIGLYDSNNTGLITLSSLKLRVSNDIDAAQIYRGYAFRDPALAGVPDLDTAQLALTRTALAHTLPIVCQRKIAIVDDALSLADRDLVGA